MSRPDVRFAATVAGIVAFVALGFSFWAALFFVMLVRVLTPA